MSVDLVARGLAQRSAAQGKSANTRALIAAIRNWGCLPAPQHRLLASDIPALALGSAGAASSINAQGPGGASVPRSDPRITYVAGAVLQAGANYPLDGYAVSRCGYYGASNAQGDPLFGTLHHAFEFVHSGTAFEIPVTGHGANAPYNLRLLVDDGIAATQLVPVGTGELYFLKFTFPVSRTRRIRIETFGVPTNGVNVANPADVSAAGRRYPIVTIIGDSFVEGAGAQFAANGEAALVARLLGLRGAVAGVGATGLIATGGLNTAGYAKVNWSHPERLRDLTLSGITDAATGAPLGPALGIVMGSINDSTANGFAAIPGATSYEDAIARQCWTLIDAWRATNPARPLVFFGPTWTNGSPTIDAFRTRDAMRRAIAGVGGPAAQVWFVDRFGPAALLRTGAIDYLETTASTTNGSNELSSLGSNTGIIVGSAVIGAGIPADCTVSTIVNASTLTLSHPCTASAAGTAVQFRNSSAALYTSLSFGDTTHPSPSGHELDALWMAAELRRLIFTEFA